jgi:signal transduction histidine kinase
VDIRAVYAEVKRLKQVEDCLRNEITEYRKTIKQMGEMSQAVSIAADAFHQIAHNASNPLRIGQICRETISRIAPN